MPKVETLVWRAIPEAAARVAALQTGQVDIALRIPPNQVPALERDPNLRISSALSTRTYYIAFNNMTTGKGTPIMDPRVRLAMNHGMDLQAIIRSVFNGQAQRVNSLIGNVQFGHDPTLPPMAYDPARAKQLLAEAGVPNGFKVGLACPSGAYANDKEACQAIAGSLGKIGIEVDLQIMESNRFWDLEAKKQLPPLFFDGVGDRFQDPGHPAAGRRARPHSNWTAFEKKEFTDLIDQAGEHGRPGAAEAALRQARARHAGGPAVPLPLAGEELRGRAEARPGLHDAADRGHGPRRLRRGRRVARRDAAPAALDGRAGVPPCPVGAPPP